MAVGVSKALWGSEPVGVPGDGTRERIISAAERLFAEKGLHGVSLREIR